MRSRHYRYEGTASCLAHARFLMSRTTRHDTQTGRPRALEATTPLSITRRTHQSSSLHPSSVLPPGIHSSKSTCRIPPTVQSPRSPRSHPRRRSRPTSRSSGFVPVAPPNLTPARRLSTSASSISFNHRRPADDAHLASRRDASIFCCSAFRCSAETPQTSRPPQYSLSLTILPS